MDLPIITGLHQLYTVTAPTGRVFHMADRPFCGLSFCTEGKITYTHQGKSYVSDPSCAILLPQGGSYTLYQNQGGSFPVIDFQTIAPQVQTFQVIPISSWETYRRDYERLSELSLQPSNRLACMSLLYAIFDRLEQENRPYPPALTAALRYLNKQLYNPVLNNRRLAEQAGISQIYLRKLFLAAFSTTPKQYILSLRLTRAKQLLAETHMPVWELALACGFSSLYYFSAIFKEKVGTTPSAYRITHRREGI